MAKIKGFSNLNIIGIIGVCVLLCIRSLYGITINEYSYQTICNEILYLLFVLTNICVTNRTSHINFTNLIIICVLMETIRNQFSTIYLNEEDLNEEEDTDGILSDERLLELYAICPFTTMKEYNSSEVFFRVWRKQWRIWSIDNHSDKTRNLPNHEQKNRAILFTKYVGVYNIISEHFKLKRQKEEEKKEKEEEKKEKEEEKKEKEDLRNKQYIIQTIEYSIFTYMLYRYYNY